MSRQDLRTLFGLDGPRLMRCYDPENRWAREFADAFAALPDGGDLRQVRLPLEHLGLQRFRLHGSLDLAELRREVEGPYREVCEQLVALPLFGYNDSALMREHNQAWSEHVGRGAWWGSWHHHYAAALVIHFYRRITPPEFQSAGHMRLVHAVAAAADLLTNHTLVTDDWLDRAPTRNGRPSWHLRHPRSFMIDAQIMAIQALNVLEWTVPDRHPFKREMHDLAVRQIANAPHYFAYHSTVEHRRAGQAGADGSVRSAVPVEDLTLDAYLSATWSRATDWIRFLVNTSRLLACYGEVLPDSGAFTDYVAGATTAICVADDIVDAATGEDIRTGEVAIQLCLAVQRAKGLLGPVSDADAADILSTLKRHVGVDTEADVRQVQEMYDRHGIPALALDYLEAVLDRLLQSRRAALEECGAPGDLPAFMLQWLAADGGGATERAGESGALLRQERFRDLVASLNESGEDGFVAVDGDDGARRLGGTVPTSV